MDFDIIIVGAGPAGANLARLIGGQYKVMILDKRNLAESVPGRIQKCCGGLLAPDAQQMMAKLGLGIPKSVLVDPQLFAVKTLDLNAGIERDYQRYYYNMDREAFDRWMVSLLPSSVTLKMGVLFKEITPIVGGYEVSYTENGLVYKTTAKIIVGADGATSRIRQSLKGASPSPKSYIAIQEWFEVSSYTPHFTAIFDKSITDFYAWVIPKGQHILLGAALDPHKEPWDKYHQLKDKLKAFNFDLKQSIKTEGAFINRTQSINQVYWGTYGDSLHSGVALIGEAAGAISPSSAEGISYALRTSLCLAISLGHGLDGFLDRYHKAVSAIKVNILLKQLKSPAMYYPPLRKAIMRSGFTSL